MYQAAAAPKVPKPEAQKQIQICQPNHHPICFTMLA